MNNILYNQLNSEYKLLEKEMSKSKNIKELKKILDRYDSMEMYSSRIIY